MRHMILAAVSSIALAAPTMTALAQTTVAAPVAANPLLGDWITDPQGVPPYGLIKPADYQPALEIALGEARRELGAITRVRSAPTFANTIEALERMGLRYQAISAAFFRRWSEWACAIRRFQRLSSMWRALTQRRKSRPPKKRSCRC